MIFSSLGSNFGAATHEKVSRRADDSQEDDTYAWRVRKVVGLSWRFVGEAVIEAQVRSTSNSRSNFRQAIEIRVEICAKRAKPNLDFARNFELEGWLVTTTTIYFTIIGHT